MKATGLTAGRCSACSAAFAARVDPSITAATSRELTPRRPHAGDHVTRHGALRSFNTNAQAAAPYVLGSAQRCTLGLRGARARSSSAAEGYDVMFEQVGSFRSAMRGRRVIAQTGPTTCGGKGRSADANLQRVQVGETQRVRSRSTAADCPDEGPATGPDTAPKS